MRLPNVAWEAMVLASLSVMAAETKPADTKPVTGKAEAAVDKTPDKYRKADAQRFWVTPEFLMWWTKDGPVHDVYFGRTLGGSAPRLGNPNTQLIFRNNDQDYGMQLGGRLTFGMWVDDARKWGFELSGFALQEKEARWSYRGTGADSAGFLTFDGPPFAESSWRVSVPGTPGSAAIRSESQLWGLEALGLHNLQRQQDRTLDLTFGVRHLNLSEDFEVAYNSPTYHDGGQDLFEARNRFYGAKVGVKFSLTAWERLLVNIEPSVALGANDECLKISGSSFLTGATVAGPGSIYALYPNIGDCDKLEFAVVPEVKIGLGCKITKSISFNANYNFLFVSNVVRPGEQITRRRNMQAFEPTEGPINPAGTPREPAPRFKTSDYWAHGLGVNLKIQF